MHVSSYLFARENVLRVLYCVLLISFSVSTKISTQASTGAALARTWSDTSVLNYVDSVAKCFCVACSMLLIACSDFMMEHEFISLQTFL